MTKNSTLLILLALTLVIFLSNCSPGNVRINQLTVEYSTEPLGIDVETPRFGWQMQTGSNQRGVYQTAYRIEVKDPAGATVWNSGKVNGSEALAIPYQGTSLEPATRYDWTVTVWDQNEVQHSAVSWFETGLMSPNQDAWNGAKWIGGSDEDLVFFSHYQIIFDLSYDIRIEEGSTKAGFIYGANDIRLMNQYKNIFQIENGLNESYIKIELDISGLENGNGPATLNVYRSGYTPEDNPSIPIKTFRIKPEILNITNKNVDHHIAFSSIFGQIAIVLDGEPNFYQGSDAVDLNNIPVWRRPKPGGIVNLNPIGEGGDYLPFGMVCDIGFAAAPGQNALFSNLEISNNRSPNNILFSQNPESDYKGIFQDKVPVRDGKFAVEGGSEGIFVTANPSRNSAPMLRTEFTVNNKVASARLYVTARGIYEIQINGQKVGHDYYNPGQTQYNKSHFYQTYDVTDMLSEENNAIGAMMAEGWWSGLLSFGSIWNHFGDRQSLIAKLVIDYEDGSKETLVTDENWKFFNAGPIIYSSLDLGEIYDATRESETEGWSKAGFDDRKWKNAVVVPLEGTSYTSKWSPNALDFSDMKLIGQIGNNAGIYETLSAKTVREVRPGVFVYDMGQNFVGVPRITFENGIAGDTVILRVSEMLYPDLPESGDNAGMLMTENYRAALCQDIYIMKDGTQTFQPKFTSRGYQYIEITGIDKPLPPSSVEGVAISSVLDLTAHYETSNEKVNQLWSNLCWSNVDNFLTLPTDCPQRNERMGWSGDISVFSRTATYLSNTDQFLRRHMIAMRDVQQESGKFTDIAPIGGGFGGILWGSAGITVPWEVYLQYNDVSLLEEHYDAMVAYIDHLQSTIDPETGLSSDVQLGDWLGPQNMQLGPQFLATAYHIYDLQLMQRIAEILDKEEDANRFKKLYKERKAFFNDTFINEDRKTVGLIGGGGFGSAPGELRFEVADTQTSYAVGLALGAFNDEIIPDMAKNLAEAVRRENLDDEGKIRPEYSLMTGFIGTAWISKALSDHGYDEAAYRLLQNDQYPSWLYSIDQGATTIWERLNGYTEENGFGGNNSMNSFNHYSFGAVGQWMIAYSLGIQRGEPGFQEFILQPTPDPTGQMTRAQGYYDSMYGRIESSWELSNGQLTYKAVVPPNTHATLYLPAGSENDILDSDGVELEGYQNGKGIFNLKSGEYTFQTKL